MSVRPPLSWEQLEAMTNWTKDYKNGPTNAQSRLRLFGQPENKIRVTLYRDNHAWCPYCQKVWLFLEEKRIPYKISKVTMFCYGEKESWYLKKVPSGMLPAVELDGKVITESDDILFALERKFGPLGDSMASISSFRKLERQLFEAWTVWLCYDAWGTTPEAKKKHEMLRQQKFEDVLAEVDKTLNQTKGPYFLSDFSLADVIFIPYVERMLASLFYYKGFNMKEASPGISRWFAALETRETYRGTQSDAHTHCHDLPPQMGGCWEWVDAKQQLCKRAVDEGPWDYLPDCGYAQPADAVEEALARTIKHRYTIIAANCVQDKAKVEEALRCALTSLISAPVLCPVIDQEMATALIYIRDRVNVPRDMSIWAARKLRAALTASAVSDGLVDAPPIPYKHRYDQQPAQFKDSERKKLETKAEEARRRREQEETDKKHLAEETPQNDDIDKKAEAVKAKKTASAVAKRKAATPVKKKPIEEPIPDAETLSDGNAKMPTRTGQLEGATEVVEVVGSKEKELPMQRGAVADAKEIVDDESKIRAVEPKEEVMQMQAMEQEMLKAIVDDKSEAEVGTLEKKLAKIESLQTGHRDQTLDPAYAESGRYGAKTLALQTDLAELVRSDQDKTTTSKPMSKPLASRVLPSKPGVSSEHNQMKSLFDRLICCSAPTTGKDSTATEQHTLVADDTLLGA